jgi:two-component system phosphate regulon sensor histidine kinase PhoR
MLIADGNILRVSREAGSVFRIYTAAIPIIIIVSAIIFVTCIFVAHLLTRSLMRPVQMMADHLTYSGPTSADVNGSDRENQLIQNSPKMNRSKIYPAKTDQMEINHEEHVTYEELQPLLDTIRKQNENLLDHVKMRQDFTANVSHELKTPLTSISGYAELIENKMVDDPEDIIRFAREIYRNANRLLTLINDIIRLSQFDSEEKDEVVKNEDFERIDLFAVARSCINVLAVSAQKHHVSISIKGETAYIYSTRQMMEELVFNLCDNAIRYNRENGTVDLSVWNRAGRVVLTVSDSGIGISVAHQERIFERFYRVDKSRSKSTGGTGLGLAIVKHIIARHDAELELISEIGKGTQIIISMPECL